MVKGVYFEIKTPLGITVRTTKAYWTRIITTKHPSIARFEKKVKETLKNPDQIRRSKQDERVHLYYKSIGELYICVVADHINEEDGYVITSYLTDRIKEGEKVYDKTENLL